MANQTLDQFPTRSPVLGTDTLVGYRTPTTGGELKCTVNDLLNTSILASKRYVARAWVVASYRTSNNGAVAASPRIISSYNVTGITRIATYRFHVTFPTGVFTDKNYCVLGDAAGTNNDKVWVAANGYKEVPSESGLVSLLENNDFAHKSPLACKFESSNPAYLPEFYIAFF
jgi:hypothetical protein